MNLAQGMSMRRAGVCLKGAFLFLVIFSLTAGHTFGKYSGGTGEPNNPYQIGSADDLLVLAADTNDYNQCFILIADIDLGGQVFTTAVIARDVNNADEVYFDGVAFAGVFNGAGHKVINLTIDTNGAGNDYLGLFGDVNSGEIKNLGMESVRITGGNESYYLGGLVGYSDYGSISNCLSTGRITGGYHSGYLGGLAGESYFGSISNCFSTGVVIGGDESYFLGGLVGGNCGTISNCFSTGAVTGGDSSFGIGGLSGIIDIGSISNCYSTGNVIGGDWVGGLVGEVLSGSINNCYFLDVAGPNNGYGTPLMDEQMKQQASFVGWDFVGETANGTEEIWRMCVDRVNHPFLWWQFNRTDFTCPDGVDIFDLAVLCDQWLVEKIPADVAPLGGDGIVNFADFAVFADQWAVTQDIYALIDFAEQWLKVGLPSHSADIWPRPDGDGQVNAADLAVMGNYWMQGISIPVDTYDYIKLSVDSATHDTYGLAYPLTYQFSIPPGAYNLGAYKRYAEGDAWTAIPEKTADDFFNGVEAVRFDYVNNKVYVSVAFGDTSDEIHLKVTNTLDQTVDVNYEGIPDYYDNRSAAVVATGDDWDGYSLNDTGFYRACDAFASRKIWFTPGIITQGAANIGSPLRPPVIWSHVQAKIDAGYVEAASHSRIHPGTCTGHPYKYRGSHTGPDNRSVLTDSNANSGRGFPMVGRPYLLGATITNDTDGSSGIITFNDGSNIICDEGLSGGIDNDWDYGDTYTIDNYAREIGGSKDEIINNLDLPYKKGTKKYLYAWIEPCGNWDANVTVELGEWKYLADRSTESGDGFATWDSANGVFKRSGISIWLDTANLVDANSKFDSVVSARGIYHIMLHPREFTWMPGTWVFQHLDYVKGKKDIWYAGYGHLYLYHYADSQNKVTVTKIVGQ